MTMPKSQRPEQIEHESPLKWDHNDGESTMETLVLATYILVWPVISLAVLGVIVVATLRDFYCAHRDGREVV